MSSPQWSPDCKGASPTPAARRLHPRTISRCRKAEPSPRSASAKGTVPGPLGTALDRYARINTWSERKAGRFVNAKLPLSTRWTWTRPRPFGRCRYQSRHGRATIVENGSNPLAARGRPAARSEDRQDGMGEGGSKGSLGGAALVGVCRDEREELLWSAHAAQHIAAEGDETIA